MLILCLRDGKTKSKLKLKKIRYEWILKIYHNSKEYFEKVIKNSNNGGNSSNLHENNRNNMLHHVATTKKQWSQ